MGAICDWPLHERLELVAQILHLASAETRPREESVTAAELRALLGTENGVDVSDEDIERWLHERRMARAG